MKSFVHEVIEDAFNSEEGEILCQSKAITKEGKRYGTGECVALLCEGDELLFRYVSTFHYKRKDYLLCDLLVVNEFNTHFNSYETEKSGYLTLIRSMIIIF